MYQSYTKGAGGMFWGHRSQFLYCGSFVILHPTAFFDPVTHEPVGTPSAGIIAPSEAFIDLEIWHVEPTPDIANKDPSF